MRHDPFAHLDLEQIERAERKARADHPILFRVPELAVFVRDPVRWIRGWRQRRAIGYNGKPQH